MKKKLPRLCTRVAYVGALAGAMPSAGIAQEQPQTLPEVVVRPTPATPSATEKYQLPVTTESVTADQMAESINVMNTEDALKYLPSLIVRKRNFGDQQSPLATRTSGLGPERAQPDLRRWRAALDADRQQQYRRVAPLGAGRAGRDRAHRRDVRAVLGRISGQFDGRGGRDHYAHAAEVRSRREGAGRVAESTACMGPAIPIESSQVSAILGNRTGDWSWWLSANHLHSQTQPLTIITALRPAAPSAAGTPVSGAFMDMNRLGQPIAVIGSGGLEHKNQDTLKGKLAYDFTPEWRAAYTIG